MELIRLYISHNNHRWHIDIPASTALEHTASLALDGITVYHATPLTPPRRPRPYRSRHGILAHLH